jgi:DNA-binding XRE family transcriptional regulator
VVTKLKFARLKSGLLQWRLAQLAGVEGSRLSLIENGRIIPSEGECHAIASALGRPTMEVFPKREMDKLSKALKKSERTARAGR